MYFVPAVVHYFAADRATKELYARAFRNISASGATFADRGLDLRFAIERRHKNRPHCDCNNARENKHFYAAYVNGKLSVRDFNVFHKFSDYFESVNLDQCYSKSYSTR